MIVTTEIPDDIAQAIGSGTGREALSKQFNFSEMEARYYLRLFSEHRTPIKHPIAVVLADIHCPYQTKDVLSLTIEYCKTLNPKTVVVNGDLVDFYKVSYWRNDPQRMRFPDEIVECRKMVERISKAFPNARKILLEGNHEMRLMNYLWSNAPELYGLDSLTIPELLHLNRWGWEYIVNRDKLNQIKPSFKIGNIHILHGHEVRVGSGAVNLARLYYQKTLVNVLVAHHHQTQEYLVKKLDHSNEGGWVMGCLCPLSAEYMAVTNWNHGFTVLYYDDDGDVAVRHRKIINGKIL